MVRRRSARSLLPILLLVLPFGGCAIPNVIEALNDRCPPPEFGRPGWVRTVAGIGGVVGGVIGGVGSIVLLPVTYPISLLADDGFGEQASGDFVLFPAIGLAAVGHCLLGTPADILDWSCRRVWIDQPDPVMSYEWVPLEGPVMPVAPEEMVEPEQPLPAEGEAKGEAKGEPKGEDPPR